MANINRTLELKLRLGEMTLATLTLRLNVVQADVFSQGEPKTLQTCAQLELDDTTDGTFLSSAPIDLELPTATVLADKLIYVPAQYPRYYIDLSTDFEAYQQKFSSKSRSGIRRKVRKFAKESGGEIEWSVHTSGSEIRDFNQRAVAVSRQTYQHKMFDAGLPESQAYCDDMVYRAERGEARGYLISVKGEAVAYLYCPINNGVVMYSYLGYLDEYRELSPGTVLLWRALEDLFETGQYRLFDFTQGGLEGQHSQKSFFSTGSVQCADIYVLHAKTVTKLKVYSAITIDRISESIGRTLEKLGLKKRIRQLMRNLR